MDTEGRTEWRMARGPYPGAGARHASPLEHHHPGFVLVYVLEGDVVTKISGQDQRTYSAGQMFYEQPGSTHEISRNASMTKQARILAMIFAKKGAPLVTPA